MSLNNTDVNNKLTELNDKESNLSQVKEKLDKSELITEINKLDPQNKDKRKYNQLLTSYNNIFKNITELKIMCNLKLSSESRATIQTEIDKLEIPIDAALNSNTEYKIIISDIQKKRDEFNTYLKPLLSNYSSDTAIVKLITELNKEISKTKYSLRNIEEKIKLIKNNSTIDKKDKDNIKKKFDELTILINKEKTKKDEIINNDPNLINIYKQLNILYIKIHIKPPKLLTAGRKTKKQIKKNRITRRKKNK